MVVKKPCITLPIVGFQLWTFPYFTLLNRPLYRCAILSVSELVGAHVRQRSTIHSQCAAKVGPSGRSEAAENVIRAITDGNTICLFSWLMFPM